MTISVASYSKNTAVNVSTYNLTKPTGVAVGDLLLVLLADDATGGIDQWDGTTRPAGFDFISEFGSGNSDSHIGLFSRIADGTELATLACPSIESKDQVGYYLRITGADTRAPLNIRAEYVSTGNAATHAIPSLTTTLDDSLIIAFGSGDGGDTMPFSLSAGWTLEDEQQTSTSGTELAGFFATKPLATAGASGILTVTPNQNDEGFTGVQIAIDPPVTNLFTQSADLDHTTWDDSDSGDNIIFTDNGGGEWELDDKTNNAEHHFWEAGVKTDDGIYTTSFLLKYVDAQYVGTRYNNGSWQNLVFDIQNGTVFSGDGGSSVVAASIGAADADGFRLVQWTLDSVNWNFPKFAFFNSAGSATTYTGSNRTVLMKEPQHEAGQPAHAYQETPASAETTYTLTPAVAGVLMGSITKDLALAGALQERFTKEASLAGTLASRSTINLSLAAVIKSIDNIRNVALAGTLLKRTALSLSITGNLAEPGGATTYIITTDVAAALQKSMSVDTSLSGAMLKPSAISMSLTAQMIWRNINTISLDALLIGSVLKTIGLSASLVRLAGCWSEDPASSSSWSEESPAVTVWAEEEEVTHGC